MMTVITQSDHYIMLHPLLFICPLLVSPRYSPAENHSSPRSSQSLVEQALKEIVVPSIFWLIFSFNYFFNSYCYFNKQKRFCFTYI